MSVRLRKTCFSIKAPMTLYTVATTKPFKSRLRCLQKSHERLDNICGHYAVWCRIVCLKGFQFEPQLDLVTAIWLSTGRIFVIFKTLVSIKTNGDKTVFLPFCCSETVESSVYLEVLSVLGWGSEQGSPDHVPAVYVFAPLASFKFAYPDSFSSYSFASPADSNI